MSEQAWTMGELLAELERYERELQEADMMPEMILSFVDRAHRFVGWLGGDYKPQLHADRPGYRSPTTAPALRSTPAEEDP